MRFTIEPSRRLHGGWTLRSVGRAHPALVVSAVLALIAVGAVLVYQTGGTQRAWPHVMYVPVLIAAAALGLRAAVTTGVIAGLAIGPLMPLDAAAGVPQSLGNWLTRLGFFALIGVVAGATHRLAAAHLDALGASEAAFRALVQNGSDLIVVLDASSGILFASPSARSLLGHEPDELVGRRFDELVDRGDVNRVHGALEPHGRGSVEVQIQHRDGAWRTFELVITDLTADPSVGGVVVNGRDITERRAVEAELVHQATHDHVTGLPARDHVIGIVARAMGRQRHHHGVAVAVISIDRFKVLVDSLGHELADRLLAVVADRLQGRVRPGDTLGRYGMNELVLCCEAVESAEAAVDIAERVLSEFASPVMVADEEIHLTGSAGVAFAAGSTAAAGQLVKDAYAAMRHAAQQDGTRCVLYHPELGRQAATRLRTETGLHHALEHDQLVLHYQPIVRLPTAEILGFEALIRWQHPTLGLIPPAEFIPVAEETGLIVPIGAWVLEQACTQAAAWNSSRPPAEPLNIAVNISAAQLTSGRLAEHVSHAIERSGIDPAQLTLEITESVLVSDHDNSHRTLEALRAIGVRIAVDDFGTGYSSLAYLHELTIDTLKIDRTFIRQLSGDGHDRAIVGAVIGLAHNLGLATIAEGIETQDQARTVFELGGDFAQGFLYATPLPAAEATALLHTGKLQRSV